MILEGSTIALTLAAFCEYWRTRRGPLVLLTVAVTHARAALVTARWMAARVPGDLARVYPQAVEFVRKSL